MKNLKKNWFVVSKMTLNWWILTWALEILKTSASICSFCEKYLMFDLKKYRRVIFHDTEELCKIKKKNCLVVWTCLVLLSKNWLVLLSRVENVWISNLQRSYVSWPWRMMQNLKRYGLSVSKLTWGVWRILTRPLKNLHFNGVLLTKVYNVWAKNVQKSYVWWGWRLMQNWRETDFVF